MLDLLWEMLRGPSQALSREESPGGCCGAHGVYHGREDWRCPTPGKAGGCASIQRPAWSVSAPWQVGTESCAWGGIPGSWQCQERH